MQFQSLSQEDPLEEGMATHSSILVWRTPWTEGPAGLQSTGLQRVEQSSTTTRTLSIPRASSPPLVSSPTSHSLFFNNLHSSLTCCYLLYASQWALRAKTFLKSSEISLIVQWLGICLANIGDMGSIPGQGTRIPHAAGKLNLLAVTTEACSLWSLSTTNTESTHHN